MRVLRRPPAEGGFATGDPLPGIWLGQEGCPGTDGKVGRQGGGLIRIERRRVYPGLRRLVGGRQDGKRRRRRGFGDGARDHLLVVIHVEVRVGIERLTVPRLASDWISLAEAADIFASANVPISRSTLARWATTGKLQSIRPGRRIYVRRAQIRGLLQPRRRSVHAVELQPGLFEEWTG